MKVLHVPFCYYPDPVGGTEVYVEGLTRFQRESGVETAVAAPDKENSAYTHGGSPVYRFRIATELTLRQVYGEGDPEAAQEFCKILDRVRPDVVHLHGFTSGVSIRLVRSARGLGLPVAYTYHTPSVTCVRGTLLRWGSGVCDGEMDVQKCAACMLQGKGVPKAASRLLGALPPGIGARLGAWGLVGSGWTALRATELVEVHNSAARELFAEVDSVVAVCEWARDVLIRNGVDARKIILCRQGLGGQVRNSGGERPRSTNGLLRIAFLGRLDATKGVEILIDALQLAPELRASVDIFAVTQGAKAQALRDALLAKSARDKRICFKDPIPAESIVDRLREYDVLAVPSQWMETGPLVVYESFAAGTPVLGSNLGGIAELVRHDVNGLLVEASSREAWAKALRRLVEEPALLPKLRLGIGPVRTMQHVAGEMQSVYERLVRPDKQAQAVC